MDGFMQEFMPVLSGALTAFLATMLSLVSAAVARWVWAKGSELFERVESWNPTVADILEQGADFAVKAAEKAGSAGLVIEKKNYAMGILDSWLMKTYDIDLDLDLIGAAVEVAVEKNFPKLPKTDNQLQLPIS